MGGGYYDERDMEEAAPVAAAGYTEQAARALAQTSLHPEADPVSQRLVCSNQTGVVMAVDVTGSMGDWTKIIWDKLPMFYGQIMLQNYLNDPAISFAAIGDACDGVAPLQVCQFAQGGQLDAEIGKIWTFQAGGGNEIESYDLAAFYYTYMVEMPRTDTKPFFFFTGDEGVYPSIRREWIAEKLGVDVEKVPTMKDLFRDLRTKFHVFMLYKPYSIESKRQEIYQSWEQLIGGESILELVDPRAIVDTMLGAIAVVSGSRTLDAYLQDMTGRGQTHERQTQVKGLLEQFAGQQQDPSVDGSRAVFDGLRYSIAANQDYQPADGDVDEESALREELERTKRELAALKMCGQETVAEPPVEIPVEIPSGKYSCAACTFMNALTVSSCEMCGSANPNYVAPPAPAPTAYYSS
eukprot:TRINITY_DN24323_c0_g1_i1.p1 TRINITY_DN24323_c0_g1~~TRINITY_DN24323_c0_g1_i1.p1  ORF type:complete len:409 (+),score=116.12 TRINITY_DN24323_c0_g1_i1:257-1483(+)